MGLSLRSLQKYDIIHKAGENNKNANGLSRSEAIEKKRVNIFLIENFV